LGGFEPYEQRVWEEMAEKRAYRGNAHRGLAELDAWTSQRREEALEPDLPIVDAHHHLWEDARGRYRIDEFLSDIDAGHHIVATVFVEGGAMYRAAGPAEARTVGEVEFANGIAAMSASGFFGTTHVCAGIVGHADMSLGERVRPVLERLVAAGNGRLRGIRHGVPWDSGEATRFGRHRAPPHLLCEPAFQRGVACLEPLGLSFDTFVFHPQLPDVEVLLRALPDTPVILNHAGGVLGLPPHDADRAAAFAIWRDRLRRLAPYPNLYVKLGGLAMLYCGWDFHFRDLPPTSAELAEAWRPYIETCIETFGPDRCMMESNFPVDKQSCGYGVLWNALKRITRHCSGPEKSMLYHDTAARVYRLPAP